MDEKILNYWFPNHEFNKFWFKVNKETDNYIYNNFYNYLIELQNDNNITFTDHNNILAKIIVLDQFSRNIYRDSKKAYQNDTKAIKLAKEYFLNKYDKLHTLNKIIFALMPFRHSEIISDQEFVIKKLESLNDKSILYNKFYKASINSYNTIKTIGKFPNRIIN